MSRKWFRRDLCHSIKYNNWIIHCPVYALLRVYTSSKCWRDHQNSNIMSYILLSRKRFLQFTLNNNNVMEPGPLHSSHLRKYNNMVNAHRLRRVIRRRLLNFPRRVIGGNLNVFFSKTNCLTSCAQYHSVPYWRVNIIIFTVQRTNQIILLL